MFITTNTISELAQQHANDQQNEQSEAVTEFGNEEDAEGSEDKDSNSISESEELRAIQIESESIRAAERLSQEHASKHVPRLGMTFTTSKEALVNSVLYCVCILFL